MTEPIASVDGLDTEVQTALRRLVLTLADSKRLLGIRYSDWLLGAPSVETAIAASSMAQDEWGHGRLLYAMLKDFGLDPMEFEHEREAAEYASMDALDAPFEDWAAVVAGIVVVDGALYVALEGFSAGVYEPARHRVGKMLSEEEFHVDLGRAWFRKLAGGTEDARDRLRQRVGEMLPATLAWLAPDDLPHRLLADFGVTEPSAALRARFEERVGPALELAGVDVSTVRPEREGRDEVRGRGPGQPDHDAIERARGDRNRHLFAE